MRAADHHRLLEPSFSERHHVVAALGALVVLVCVAVVTGGAIGAVIVRIVDLMVAMVGGGS